MDAVEEETTVVVGQDQEKDAIREEEKEMPVGEVTVIKEKKGLFNLWENRKKKEKQERDNYTRSLQLTMTGYAVAEETRPGEWMPVYENERGSYIFNSRDLCMIEHIPENGRSRNRQLQDRGRMKTALYVATVARTYRIAIDDYLEKPGKNTSPRWSGIRVRSANVPTGNTSPDFISINRVPSRRYTEAILM